MAMEIKKEEFMSPTTDDKKMIRPQSVFLSDKGFYFYNPINGSTHKVVDTTLKFTQVSYFKFTQPPTRDNVTVLGIINI